MKPEVEPRTTTRRALLRWGGIGLMLAVGIGYGAARFGGDASGDEDRLGMVFTIPYGQSRYVNAGLESAVPMPTQITFGPGEVAAITVINQDDVAHLAGPFLVGPGKTFIQRFPKPGEYPINCTVNPAESIVVTVEG